MGVFPPEAGIIGGPDGTGNGVVGAIGGAVSVSPMGGATYTIPITVPTGIGEIKPNLSVNYNSQSGNGLLGWGWTLGGISAITRVGKAAYYDQGTISGVSYHDDRFAIDGQRLLLVNDKNYGSNEAEYRTEIDNMAKIVSYTEDGITNGPAKFKVWTSDGLIMEYGFTPDSKMLDICEDDATMKEAGLWLLNRVEDRNGNFMEYHYIMGGASYYLSYIKYTGNSNIDISPCYTVLINYDTERRNTTDTRFVGNNEIHQKWLIDEISIYYSNEVIAKYIFDYYDETRSNAYMYERLKSITYSCGGVSYNPTTISWGANDYNYPQNDDAKMEICVDGNSPITALGDKVKYSGDFNGDGLSDLVVFYEDNGSYKAKTYLNQADTTIIDSHGQTHYCLNFHHSQTFDFDSDINGIYVVDFDEDGLDEFLIVYRDTEPRNHDELYFGFYHSEIENGNPVIKIANETSTKYRISKGIQECPLIGDFLGEGRNDVIIQIPNSNYADPMLLYLSYTDGMGIVEATYGTFFGGQRFAAADFNGDGITEIWCANDSGSHVNVYNAIMYRMTSKNSCVQFNTDGVLTNLHQLFIGDFNGDGNADFLTYVPNENGGHGTWQVNYFKESALYWSQFDITELLPPFFEPGDHSFRLKDKTSDHPSFHYIETGDYNGDGISDLLIVAEDYEYQNRMFLFFGPLMHTTEGMPQANFAATEEYSLFYIPPRITLCSGNFLGKENRSLLYCSYLFNLNPMTNRYSVDSITDGMGNLASFDYEYLMPCKRDFYSMSANDGDSGKKIRAIPFPRKALRSLSSENPLAGTPTSSTNYSYKSLLVHNFGRGFLGFKASTTVTKIGEKLIDSTMTFSSFDQMRSHCFLVTESQFTYNSRNILVSKTLFENDYLERHTNQLVFAPVVSKQKDYNYSQDDGSLQIVSIIQNDYQKDSISTSGEHGFYINTLKLPLVSNGITDGEDEMIDEVSSCKQQTFTSTEYEQEDTTLINNWIVNRPKSMTVRAINTEVTDEQKTLITYDYMDDANYLPWKITNYPGGDIENANGLATTTTYNYDLAGNPTEETLSATNDSLPPRPKYFQYDDYRFVSAETNVLGDITKSHFEPKYGELQWTEDCNRQRSEYDYDNHLGTTIHVTYPDNTQGYTAKRWINDDGNIDEDAPAHAAYYKWSCISGNKPTKTFFDAAGRELRTVCYGLSERPIYQDTHYNDFGMDSCKSLPYFRNDVPQYTTFEYDDILRLKCTSFPDGSSSKIVYNGMETENTFMTSDGRSHSTWQELDYRGLTIASRDAMGNTVNYGYYPDGKLKWTQIGTDTNLKDSLQYDAAGNRTLLFDPDYGTVTNTYDAYGQVKTNITPKGDHTEYDYDNLGRMTESREYIAGQSTPSAIESWLYDNSDGKKGLLKQVQHIDNDGTHTIRYTYDELLRNDGIIETIGDRDYVETLTYNALSQVKTITYPSGVTIRNAYSNGILKSIFNEDGERVWAASEVNALGQICQFSTGKRTSSHYYYNPVNQRLDSIKSYTDSKILQSLSYVINDFGNLEARTDKVRNMTETFLYDNLDRLTDISLNDMNSHINYDAYGRILSKQVDGQTVFSDAQFDPEEKPHAMRSANLEWNLFHSDFDSISYTLFDKVKAIFQDEKSLQYTYGIGHQRIGMTENVDGNIRTKHYVRNCEYISENGKEKVLTYLNGPTGTFAIIEQFENTESTHYIYKDHLGSWTTITDAEGNIEQELSFDAWGNLRNPETWIGEASEAPMFDRGFTGHEHLYEFGLINMNGRMYDPVMSSFLSPDNYVQSPNNSQNFNRYSYCLNNPLKYTDPSGESIIGSFIGGIALGIIQNGINNSYYDRPFFENWEAGAAAGGMQAMFSIGIGELTQGINKPWMQSLARAGLHAGSCALNAKFDNRDVLAAAAAGFVGSIVTGGIEYHTRGLQNYHRIPAMIAGGAISSGVASEMMGGDFMDGFYDGLFVAGLNHAMHEITQLPVRQRTKQFRINKIGRLPLDSDTNGLTYGAMQTANYKMLYNVTAADVPLLDSEGNYIGTHRVLTISASSYNTLVEGDVHAYANATIIADGQVIASSPLQMESGGTLPIMQEGYTYVGDVSFEIPCTANVSLQIEGGWNVFMGSGWCVPSMGLPINADMFIPIFHHD
ncbi:MAG: hypothetical protein MJZ94_11450 [Bacteroidales bacterium]|nr:hypothetical protein [Bacteroidales bacterium]